MSIINHTSEQLSKAVSHLEDATRLVNSLADAYMGVDARIQPQPPTNTLPHIGLNPESPLTNCVAALQREMDNLHRGLSRFQFPPDQQDDRVHKSTTSVGAQYR